MTPRRAEAGFTLVESLVGLAILSSVLIATYVTVSNAINAATKSALRREVIITVEQSIDKLKSGTLRPGLSAGGQTASYRWGVVVMQMPGFTRRMVIPLRIVGWISRRTGDGDPEVVVDTVALRRAP